VAGDVTETGNASVAGILLDVNSTVVPNVKIHVYRVSSDEIGSVVSTDTVYGEKDGTFKIVLKPARYCLEFLDTLDKTGAISDPFTIMSDDTTVNLGIIRMEPYARYKGVVVSYRSIILQVILGCSPYRTVTDSKKLFFFNALPRREYRVFAEIVDTGTLKKSIVFVKDFNCVEGGLGKDDTLYVDNICIPLADFNDGGNRNKLGPVLGGGWWDAQSDGYTGGASLLISPENASSQAFDKAILDGGLRHEKSLQVKYTPGSQPGKERDFPYVYVGMNIGKDNELYNLSIFDSICFSARGNGKIRVELLQEGHFPSLIKIVAGAQKTLTSQWLRYTVTPNNLRVEVLYFSKVIDTGKKIKIPMYVEPPETWNDMGGMVCKINFLGVAGTEFWIDDIELWGVRIADMMKDRR
jgi:hypothetical protein